MKKKSIVQLVGFLCVIVVVMLGVFLALNQRENNKSENNTNTEAQNILAKNSLMIESSKTFIL